MKPHSIWKLNTPVLGFLGSILYAALAGNTATAAVLTGSITDGAFANVNLTTIGNIDWTVYGQGSTASLSPTTSKAGGAAISDLSDINPNGIPLRALGQFGNWGGSTFNWTDGTPTVAATSAYNGLQHNAQQGGPDAVGAGFSFTVAGSTSAMRTVDLWTGVHRGTSRITASLNGASPVSFDIVAGEGPYNSFARITLDFVSDNPADLLNVSLVLISQTSDVNSGNSYVNAVAVSGIPEASTCGLLALTGLAGAFRRNRRA